MKSGLAVVVGLLVAGPTPAEEIYVFETYDDKTGTVLVESIRRVTTLDADQVRVTIDWTSPSESSSGQQLYLIDTDLGTLRWEIRAPEENTDYAGDRQGDRLRLSGTHRGETVDETHEIDGKPFYFNPSVGLQTFARSERDKIEFWTLRPDDLSLHKMKAEKKDVEAIDVRDESVEAVGVKWGLTGFKSMFFSTTYWFRASDGLFLRSRPSRGQWSQLVRKGSTVP